MHRGKRIGLTILFFIIFSILLCVIASKSGSPNFFGFKKLSSTFSEDNLEKVSMDEDYLDIPDMFNFSNVIESISNKCHDYDLSVANNDEISNDETKSNKKEKSNDKEKSSDNVESNDKVEIADNTVQSDDTQNQEQVVDKGGTGNEQSQDSIESPTQDAQPESDESSNQTSTDNSYNSSQEVANLNIEAQEDKEDKKSVFDIPYQMVEQYIASNEKDEENEKQEVQGNGTSNTVTPNVIDVAANLITATSAPATNSPTTKPAATTFAPVPTKSASVSATSAPVRITVAPVSITSVPAPTTSSKSPYEKTSDNDNTQSKNSNTTVIDETASGKQSEAPNTVSNVDALKKKDWKKDTIAHTRGYYNADDGGAADYRIVSTANSDDGIQFIKLNNGLTAQLIFSSDSEINVMQAGIQTDANKREDITDRLNKLIMIADQNDKGIKFNNGTYTITKQINLKSISYIGSSSTELNVASNFNSGGIEIFTNRHEYVEKNTGGKLTFSHIKFNLLNQSGQSFQGKETIMVCLLGVEQCNIDCCDFIAETSNSSGCKTPIDLLWFHDGDTKNVTITSSNFSNKVPSQMAGDHWVGGCIWFSCFKDNKQISGITIDNCSFFSCAADELIGFWGASSCNNVTIQNCTLTASGRVNDNVITFKGSTYQGVKLYQNTFNIMVPCTNIIKFTAINSSDHYQVSVDKCIFNLSNNIDGIGKDNICVFYVSGITDYGSTIDITSSKFNGGGNTRYRTLLVCQNSKGITINMNDNDMIFEAGNGFLWVENSDGEFNAKRNTMNLGNTSTFFIIRDTTGLVKLAIGGNHIYNRLNGLMQGNLNLAYELYQNTFFYTDKTQLFQNDNLNINQCSLNIFGNKCDNRDNICLYYTKEDWCKNINIISSDGFE